jgi:hypothetical protein
MVSGMVCQYCRYTCHSKCAKLVPPTCGLPKEYEDYFKVSEAAERAALDDTLYSHAVAVA